MISADAFFFDIDGTLLVTRDLVHWNALHQAMVEAYGVDTNIDGLPYHGKTDVAILHMAVQRCGVSDEFFYNRLPSALAVVCRDVTAHEKAIVPEVCPAIPQLLSDIHDLKKLLGVASGNLESVGWSKVRAAGLREFFQIGSFGDRCEWRPEIFANALAMAREILGNKANVCFVGDTPDDIEAARRVGSQIVAVGSGTFTYEELASHHPDVCCRSCGEIVGKLI